MKIFESCLSLEKGKKLKAKGIEPLTVWTGIRRSTTEPSLLLRIPHLFKSFSPLTIYLLHFGHL